MAIAVKVSSSLLLSRFANRYIWLSKAYHVWLIAA